MAEEEDVPGWVLNLHDGGLDVAWVALGIDVDAHGDSLEVVLVEELWLGLSDLGGVVLLGEELSTVTAEGSVRVLGKDLGDGVQDEEHGGVSLVVVDEELLDVGDVLLVGASHILVLLLIHGGDEGLEVIDLSLPGEGVLSEGVLLSLEVSNSGSADILLLSDLNTQKDCRQQI